MVEVKNSDVYKASESIEEGMSEGKISFIFFNLIGNSLFKIITLYSITYAHVL